MLESKGTKFEAVLSPFAKVIIGDENSADFRPHARFTRFGAEDCYLSFGPNTVQKILPTFDGQKVEWTDGSVLHRFFPLGATPNAELGGFEYEFVLGAHPGVPTVLWPIATQGLDLFPQPALTKAESDRGNTRPDYIIGGYCCYHQTKGGIYTVAGEGEKFRTGKAFDLHRWIATDALGATWFPASTFDKTGLQLAMVVGPEFATATYPVTIGPTVGYTSLGASLDGTGDFSLVTNQTAGSSGDANPGTAFYGGRTAGATHNVYVAAYVDGTADPFGNALIATSSAISQNSGTKQFFSAAITWTGIVNGTQYWLAGWSQHVDTETAYDAGSATGFFRQATAATPTNPYPNNVSSGAFDNRVSIYVDFTASGGATDQPYQPWGQRGPILAH